MKKLLLLLLLFPIYTNALEYPNINSKYVEIYDITDSKVLYENNSMKSTSIASLTKIATIITALENIKNLDDQIIITADMINSVDPVASIAGLKVGDKLTYRDLLYASMLPSGADATNSIAILNCGSIDCFVDKMNYTAKKLNLSHTNFTNVTGLDDNNHYSSVQDIRKLLVYALKNENFKTIFKTKEYKLSNGMTVMSTLYKYSDDPDFIIGGKTGYTIDAGYCLASLNIIEGHEILIIVLNAEKIDKKYYNIEDTQLLNNFIKNNYHNQMLVNKDKVIKSIPVYLSNIDEYQIKPLDDITLFMPDDYDKDKIIIKYNGQEKMNFLSNKGDEIGKVSYYYDDKLIKEEKVIIKKDIKLSIKKVLLRYGYIPLIIIFILLIKKRKK